MIYLDILQDDDWEDYFSDVIPSKNGYFIANIKISEEERGKGKATEELLTFLNRARNEGKNVFLQAYPHEMIDDLCRFEESQNRLIKWYEKHGFIHVHQGWMYWKP